MKKLWSVILALTLVMAMAAPAFAAEQSFGGNGSGEVGITAGYTAASDNKDSVGTIYALTLSWEQTGTLAYNGGKTTYTWNQSSVSYDSKVTEKGWSGTAAVTIKAQNRSNAAMEVSCGAPTAIAGLTISGSYANSKTLLSLASAATGGFDTAGKVQEDQTTYNIAEGQISGDSYTGGKVGTITVTVTGK